MKPTTRPCPNCLNAVPIESFHKILHICAHCDKWLCGKCSVIGSCHDCFSSLNKQDEKNRYFRDKYLSPLTLSAFLLVLFSFIPFAYAEGEISYNITGVDDFNALGITTSDRSYLMNVTAPYTMCFDTIAFLLAEQLDSGTVMNVRYVWYNYSHAFNGMQSSASTPAFDADAIGTSAKYINATFNQTICLVQGQTSWLGTNVTSNSLTNYLQKSVQTSGLTNYFGQGMVGTIKVYLNGDVDYAPWTGDDRGWDIMIYNKSIVNTPPVFSNLFPADGITVLNNTPTLSFSTSIVDDSIISSVRFYVDNILKNSTFPNSSTANINFTVSTSAFILGLHTWKFNATDDAGDWSNSTERSFTIADTASPLSSWSYFDNSQTSILLAGLLFIILASMTIFFESYVRIGFLSLIVGIGWVFYFFSLTQLQPIIAIIGIALSIMYMLFSVFR